MTYYICVRDKAITEDFSSLGSVACPCCGGTPKSSLQELDTNNSKDGELILAYHRQLDYMTCKHEFIWNREGTKTIARILLTKNRFILDCFEESFENNLIVLLKLKGFEFTESNKGLHFNYSELSNIKELIKA